MHDLPFQPSGLMAWCALAWLLGVRHGLEADHLASVDALARLHPARRRAVCGVWFSLAHGVVVTLLAVCVAAIPALGQLPAAAANAVAAASAMLLLALGVANLRAVLAASSGIMLRPVGLKSRWVPWLGRLPPAWAPLAVGALFAISFDTLANAALFALAAPAAAAVPVALLLGGMFTFGMVLVDGLDGWWLARLLARSDALAWRAARAMGLAVAGLSLAMGSLILVRLAWPWLNARLDGATWLLSVAAVAVIALSYLLALYLARRRPALPAPIAASESHTAA